MPTRRRKAFFVPGAPDEDVLPSRDETNESFRQAPPATAGASEPISVVTQSPPQLPTRPPSPRPKRFARRGGRRSGSQQPADIRVEGSHEVLVLPCAGGVGATTVGALLGTQLALTRSGRVVTLDLHPRGGTLGVRFPHRTNASIRTLADAIAEHGRLTAVQADAHLQDTASRLGVLTSPSAPEVTQALTAVEYRRVAEVLQEYNQFLVVDCGGDLTHDLTHAALDAATHLLLVVGTGVDGACAATGTVDWLRCNGYEGLVSRCTAVLSRRSPARGARLPELREHLAKFCATTVVFPYDAHLAQGGVIDNSLLSTPARRSLDSIAAAVVEGIATLAARPNALTLEEN